mgnify:CR=1 FL=1
MKIILKGNPKSTNMIYKSVCRGSFPSVYMTEEGKAIKEAYQWEAKTQWNRPTFDGNLEVKIKLFFKTNRKHDIDNYNKLVLDAMNGIVYRDDSQINKLTIEKYKDKEDPRIEIYIK